MAATAKIKRFRNQNSSQNHKCGEEGVIQELREKMNRLKFRLLDRQNQNQMLRKELLLAKKVVDVEISPTPKENFTDLLNQPTNSGFRGRQEKILLLKNKLSELQARIKEMEEGNGDNLPEDPVSLPKVNKEHEKYQSKQMMDKELQYLLENSCQMKRRLEVWKKRNADLSKEEELLRLELDRLLEKSKEDQTVHESYHVVEKELRARQAEKLDMRSKLDIEKTRNEQLAEKILTLRNEITLHLNKTNDDKTLIEALTNQQGCLHDLLERQKMISESDNRRFVDDLREIQTKHSTNCNILSQLHDIVTEKRLVCLDLHQTMEQKGSIYGLEYAEEQESTAISVTTNSEQTEQSEPLQEAAAPVNDAPVEANEEQPSETEAEEIRLKEECEELKNVLRLIQEETDQMASAMWSNNKKLNEWMSQLFQTRTLLAQRNAEIRGLEETVKRLQKAMASSKKQPPQLSSTFVEDMLKTLDVLNEEHQFLLSLWELLTSEKENSVEIYNISMDCTKNIFIDATNKLIPVEDTINLEQLSQA